MYRKAGAREQRAENSHSPPQTNGNVRLRDPNARSISLQFGPSATLRCPDMHECCVIVSTQARFTQATLVGRMPHHTFD